MKVLKHLGTQITQKTVVIYTFINNCALVGYNKK